MPKVSAFRMWIAVPSQRLPAFFISSIRASVHAMQITNSKPCKIVGVRIDNRRPCTSTRDEKVLKDMVGAARNAGIDKICLLPYDNSAVSSTSEEMKKIV